MTVPKPGWLDGVLLDGSADFNCAIKDDHSLWCWGSNSEGQLGVANAELCPVDDPRFACARTPHQIPGADWASVSAGEGHTCAIKLDASLWCWGRNRAGELGIGTFGDPMPDPVRVGTANDWAAVAAGEEHTCALTIEGTLFCWGTNDSRELGGADAGTDCPYGGPCATSPVQVGTDSDWHFIDAALGITFAIRGNGALYCWGAGCEDQIGCSTADCKGQLIRVGSDEDWVSANAWASHSCAIKRDGSLWCWGGYGDGPWGTPERVDLGSPVASVAAGERQSCAVTTDGKLFCVGMDEVGQVGVDPATLSTKCEEDLPCQPNWTQLDSATDYATVVSGYDHCCALKKSDGSVWCFGSDLAGQLGRASDEICFNGAFDQSCGTRPIPIAPIE